jgi:hypothetical protein
MHKVKVADVAAHGAIKTVFPSIAVSPKPRVVTVIKPPPVAPVSAPAAVPTDATNLLGFVASQPQPPAATATDAV